jgi:hypothetical protein
MTTILNDCLSEILTFETPEPDYSDCEEDIAQSKHVTKSNDKKNIEARSELQSSNEQRCKEDTLLSEIPEPDYSDCEEDIAQSKCVTQYNDNRNVQSRSDLQSSNEQRRKEHTLLSDNFCAFDIPEPDYSSDEDSRKAVTSQKQNSIGSESSNSDGLVSPVIQSANAYVAIDPVLIEAKKLHHFHILSKDEKNLQRELQFKTKLGITLEKKPELQKVMDNIKFKNKKEEQTKNRDSKEQRELDSKLEEQARKLHLVDEQQQSKSSKVFENKTEVHEFLQVHSKIYKSKSTSTG